MDQVLDGYHTPIVHRGNDSYRTIDYRGQADLVMASCMDLVDDPKYLPFFYKRLYAIGPDQFLALADEARKRGFKKGRMFVNSIKEAKQ